MTPAKGTTTTVGELEESRARVGRRLGELGEELRATGSRLEEARRNVSAAVARGAPEDELDEFRAEVRTLEERSAELNGALRLLDHEDRQIFDRLQRARWEECGPMAADALRNVAGEAGAWITGTFGPALEEYRELSRMAGPPPHGHEAPEAAVRDELPVMVMLVDRLARLLEDVRELEAEPDLIRLDRHDVSRIPPPLESGKPATG